MSDGQSSNNAHRSIIIGKCTVDMGYNSLYFARSFFFFCFLFPVHFFGGRLATWESASKENVRVAKTFDLSYLLGLVSEKNLLRSAAIGTSGPRFIKIDMMLTCHSTAFQCQLP